MSTPQIDYAEEVGLRGLRFGARQCINDALRAAIPKEPPDEIIGAMVTAMYKTTGVEPRLHEDLARVAYKAQPIYRELWGDD